MIYAGLICVHLLKAFMHLQIDQIPKEYILQRYTSLARQDVPFERSYKNSKEKDGITKSYRQKMSLTKTVKVVHHASMSKAGYEKALDTLDELVRILSRIEPDIGCDDSDNDIDCDENQVMGEL
jgi:flagellar biosynthesis regulator FlaF